MTLCSIAEQVCLIKSAGLVVSIIWSEEGKEKAEGWLLETQVIDTRVITSVGWICEISFQSFEKV